MSAIHSLSKIANLPEKEVGSQPKILAEAQRNGVPVVLTYIIPKKTLREIAKANNLAEFVQENIRTKTHDPVEKFKTIKAIESAIVSQKIPEEIAHEIVNTYHKEFGGQFVDVFPADVKDKASRKGNVRGDANLIESILHIWSELATWALQQHSNDLSDFVSPAPIVIQHLPHSTTHGIATSKNPATDNISQVVIQSNYGASHSSNHTLMSDRFVVDV
ncbi:unnamed protein product, partial [marine sediment metagenome]